MGKEEFTFFGFQMVMVRVIYGLALIFWGIVVSLLIEGRSITSWIPGAIGFPILLFGFLTIVKPSKRNYLCL